MKAPWTATIVLGVLGVPATLVLLAAPELIDGLRAEPELGPFVIFLGVSFLFSLVWLAALLWVVFKHRGRTRTVLLACIAVIFFAGLLVNVLAPTATATMTVDLPPVHQPVKP